LRRGGLRRISPSCRSYCAKCNAGRFRCPLLGVKRTWPIAVQMSAYDPQRTSPSHCLRLAGGLRQHNAQSWRRRYHDRWRACARPPCLVAGDAGPSRECRSQTATQIRNFRWFRAPATTFTELRCELISRPSRPLESRTILAISPTNSIVKP
jgi:hypothetical protein